MARDPPRRNDMYLASEAIRFLDKTRTSGSKLKVVVLFEGRDAAGKSRVVKRITQRLLGQVPYGDVEHPPVSLPAQVHNPDYLRHPVPKEMFVPSVY
jgi:translation initiation factor IF-3